MSSKILKEIFKGSTEKNYLVGLLSAVINDFVRRLSIDSFSARALFVLRNQAEVPNQPPDRDL